MKTSKMAIWMSAFLYIGTNLFAVTLPFQDEFDNISVGDYPGANGWQNLFNGKTAYVWHDPDTAKNNQKIAYGREVNGGVTSSREIYLLDPITMVETRLTNNSWEEGWPSISPDGKKIAYTSNQDGNHEIYIMNIDGTDPNRLTFDSAADDAPSWSPDGEYITFSSMRDGNAEIYIVKADGSESPINISNNSATDGDSFWSPDGKQIIFVSDRDGNQDIWVIDLDDLDTQNLTNSPGIDSQPAYSPNGDKIAFMSDRDGNREIYVMCPDGTGQTNLTNISSYWEENPDWSPDGKEIAYHSHQNGTHIWKMDADGSNKARLTTISGNTWPSWGAELDGKSFRLISKPTWSRTDYVALPEVPDRLTYEVSVYTDSVAGRTAWVGFVEQSGGSGLCFNRFHIKNVDGMTGEVHFNTGQTGASSIILGEFTIGDWVTVRADLDFDNNIANLWVDGELKEKYVDIAPKEFDDSTWGHIQLSKWGVTEYNWPPEQGCLGVIHIDDVKIIPFYSSYTIHVNGKCGNDSWLGLEPDCSTSHGPKKTIQAAISAAWHGDTVLVWPGGYVEDISFLGKAITVRSAADAAHIMADGLYAVSFINGEDNGSVLENFVIRDSNTGIQCVASDPTLRFVTVVNCEQGIWADQGANPDISNSILWDNDNADLINTTASYSWIMDEKYQGMVGYWRFDEGSGSTANDSSSNGNDGTVTGASWTDGQIDGALNFDGDDDYVEVADDGSLSGMSQLTVGCWFKSEYWYEGSNLSVIVSKAYQGDGLYTTDCYQISNFIYAGKYTFACGIYGGGSECSFHAVIDDVVPDFDPDAWHHVALTYDSSAGQVKIYLDGQPIHTESCSIGTLHNNTTAKLRIGNFDGTSPNYRPFDGNIDDVVIYARKLSTEEIQNLYETGKDGKVMDDPLFADPAGSDYHLKSERGRYRPVDPNHPVEGYWLLDEVTSPCIDAGDPGLDASAEPTPNGGIVNIGAYGGTGYASRSMQAERRGLWSLVGDLNYDGIVNLLDFALLSENWLEEKEE